MKGYTYSDGFEEFLSKKDYSSHPMPKQQITKLFTIAEGYGKGHANAKVLIRSQKEGKADLFGICIWSMKKDKPRQRIMLNLYELERLHDYLGKLLEIESADLHTEKFKEGKKIK